MAKLRHNISLFIKLYGGRNILSCNQTFYISSKYFQNAATDYPKGIIKENVIYSPFSNCMAVDNTSNLNTFVWSKMKYWDNTAAVCGITGDNYTYRELKQLVEKFGSELLHLGFKRGQTIAVMIPNSLETPVILLGAIAAGLSVCSINHSYTADEIKHHLTNSKAAGIVTCFSCLDAVKEAMKLINRTMKIIVKSDLDNNSNKTSTRQTDDIILYDNIMKRPIGNEHQLYPNINSQDLFHISHSSGTTGLPKGVWLSHGNFVNQLKQITSTPSIQLQEFATENFQEVVPVVLPFFHNYALMLLFKCIYTSSKMIIMPKFDAAQYLNVLEKYNATILYSVPPIFQFLLTSDKVNANHTRHVKNVICAATTLTVPNLSQTFKERFPGAKFRQAYGLSESTCFATCNTLELNDYQTVGVPMPHTQIKVVDIDNGLDKGPNDKGEICFKGPQSTKGYINNPEATESAIDKDGWFHTGDVGYYNEEGYLFIVDRIKDMIKVKGFQVSPAEVEEVLKSHQSITDAAVIGIPHPKKGEAPLAFAITNNNQEDKLQLEQQIKTYLSTKLAPYKQVERVIFVDSIPKTLSGKVLKKQLRTIVGNC